jgi:hypothetical protein
MQVGISDEERDVLVAFLQERIAKERLPRSARLPLKSFLSKIDPVSRATSMQARVLGGRLLRRREAERGRNRNAHT